MADAEVDSVPRLGMLIDEARQAAARGDLEAAIGRWAAVREWFPANPSGYSAGADALRDAGRLDEAGALLAYAGSAFPESEQVALAEARLLSAKGDWPVAATAWQSVCRRFPQLPQAYVGAARALRNAGRGAEATASLATAQTLVDAGDSSLARKEALRIRREIAELTGDHPGARQALELLIAEDEKPAPKLLFALASACWNMGDTAAADTVAAQVLTSDPTHAQALFMRGRAATERGDGAQAIAYFRVLVHLQPEIPRWSTTLYFLLNWLGLTEEAETELNRIAAKWPADPAVRMLLARTGWSPHLKGGDDDAPDDLAALAARAPSPSSFRRPLVAADPQSDVLVGEVVGAETAILVFTGSLGAVSLPLDIFDRYLATFDATTIYLQDFNRFRFLAGIRSLATDFDGTVTALRLMLADLGIRRIVAIGNCIGGFAAIRYGAALDAERILAFSAPTHCPDDTRARQEQWRNLSNKRMIANFGHELTDLRPYLASTPHASTIALFFNEHDARDRAHAAHLVDLPGVAAHAEAASDDNSQILRHIIERTDFRHFLATHLGFEPGNSA